MTETIRCSVCEWENETGRRVDTSMSAEAWGTEVGVYRTTITRHLGHRPNHDATAGSEESHGPDGSSYKLYSEKAWGYDDFRAFIESRGQDPDKVSFTWGFTSRPGGGFWNKLNNVRPLTEKEVSGGPEWPLVQQAAPVKVRPPRVAVAPLPRGRGMKNMKVSLKAADAQIGFRALPDGGYEPFHDDAAMAVFLGAVRLYEPDSIVLLGDMIDLPSQSRWAQEAGFARTTQMAVDALHLYLAQLRAAAPQAKIIVIEGNHDKRMQTFIETNALAAFGIRRAHMPTSWPVMSLPHLLRLEELDIEYIDAYPAGDYWDNEDTRNIHGTKANSKGSTMAQYLGDHPYISTWAGHTHRAEIVFRKTMGKRGEAVDAYAANPGALCRVDGAVPSVHGAIDVRGRSARIVEDWQQGFGVLYYNEEESWPQVFIIRDGRAIVEGRMIEAGAELTAVAA